MTDYYNVEFSDDRRTLVRAPKELSGDYVIPEGVTTVSSRAFSGCTSLNKITFPSSLSLIEANAFNECKTLTTIYYNDDLAGWLSIRCNSYIESSHRLFLKSKTDGDYYEATTVVIPRTIIDIPPRAFYYCRSLKKVVLHSDIVSIGDCAFNKSEVSGDIILPVSLKKIGRYAFLSCKQLGSVEFSDSIEQIGDGCFAYCDNLKRLVVDKDNSLFMSNAQENAIFDKFQTRLIACAPAGAPSLTLSKTCQTVTDFAFAGCRIEKVFLHNITSPATNIIGCNSTFFVPSGMKPYYVKMGFPEDQLFEEFDVDQLVKNGKLTIIENNPFRVLGLYSNDSARNLASNATRIKRYSDVGRSVSFPTDSFLSSEIIRSNESVEIAISSLNLPADKIKHALFWFGKPNDESNALFNRILNKQWKEVSAESTNEIDVYPDGLNRSLVRYLLGNIPFYLYDFLRCVKSDEFRKSFLKEICDDSDLINQEEFVHVALDRLLEECDSKQLYAFLFSKQVFAEETQYVKNKAVGKYTTAIYSEIQRAKKVEADNPTLNLSSAKSLIKKTKEPLAKVGDFLGTSDSQYAVIADALAKQILQSGINYFNSSFEEDSPYSAFEIQSYASSIAKGKLVKQRCEENVEILKKIIDSLPPKNMRDFDKRLQSFIDSFEDAYSVSGSLFNLENALNGYGVFTPEVQKYVDDCSLEEEKNHIRTYVAKASTGFAESVLSELIDVFNKSMKEADNHSMVGLYASPLREKQSLVKQAWKLITMLACVPMDPEYKEKRYLPNRTTLGKMYNDFVLGIPQGANYSATFAASKRPVTTIDTRTEEEVFNQCHLGQGYCEAYLRRHPLGKYKEEVFSLIDDFSWAKCKSISSYRSYLKKYKSGNHTEEAKAKLEEYDRRDSSAWSSCSDLRSYELYVKNFPEGSHKKEANDKIKTIKDRITTFQVLGGLIIAGLLIALILI